MKFFDDFMDSMRLNGYEDDYEYEEEEFEEEEDIKPKKSFFFGGRKKVDPEYEDEQDDYEEEPQYTRTRASRYEDTSYRAKSKPQPSSSRSNPSNLVAFNTAKGASTVFVIKPVDDSDCLTIIDFLRKGKTIIINLEGKAIDEAQHIIDIVIGSTITLDGDIKRISPSIFIAVPNNTEISGEFLSGAISEEGITLDLRNSNF